MNSKPFYQSWTFWVNVAGLAVVVLQYLGTINVIDPKLETALLGLLNIGLRFRTAQPITLTPLP